MNRNKLTWKLLFTIYYDFYNNTITYDVTMTLLQKYYGCTTATYRSADYYTSLQSLVTTSGKFNFFLADLISLFANKPTKLL